MLVCNGVAKYVSVVQWGNNARVLSRMRNELGDQETFGAKGKSRMGNSVEARQSRHVTGQRARCDNPATEGTA